MAQRLALMGQPLYRGVVVKGHWNGTVAIAHADTWNKPRTWRKPRRIFVCSMGDLFHPEVPREAIKAVSGVAVDCPQHTFLWLTKRGERMAEYTREDPPPPNVRCGISASTQAETIEACKWLSQTSASVRWLSIEPLIERIDATDIMSMDWIVIGCESGPRRRPCSLSWVKSIVSQCQAASVPVFVKQLDLNGRVSHDPMEWPEWARVREYPRD
jgi:protein gp37